MNIEARENILQNPENNPLGVDPWLIRTKIIGEKFEWRRIGFDEKLLQKPILVPTFDNAEDATNKATPDRCRNLPSCFELTRKISSRAHFESSKNLHRGRVDRNRPSSLTL